MSFWDFFGLFRKAAKAPLPESGGTPPPSQPPAKTGKAWRPLLAADVILICGSLGLLGARVAKHMGAEPTPAPVAARPVPKPPAKPAVPAAEEPKKAEPAKVNPAAKPEPKPEPKPAKAEPPKPVKPEPAKPEAKAAPAAADGQAKAKPTTFTYVNPAASHVTLLGSFLVRTGGRKPMFRGGGKGAWECTLYLNPGASYRFRYEVVDKHGRRTVTRWDDLEVR